MSPDAGDALALCTVINWVLLLFWFLFLRFAHDWVYRLHGQWFDLSAGQFATIHYGGMVFFKLGIIMFNLLPYIALRIVG